MVKSIAAALLAVLLTGCPDDVGQNLNGDAGGLIAPRGLTGMPNGGSEVMLTWEDRATNEDGYRLEVSHVPFNGNSVLTYIAIPANATSYTFQSNPNTGYYFRVYAVTSTMQSDPSEEFWMWTPRVPPRPIGLVYYSAGSPVLHWEDVSGETAYRMEYSEDGVTWTYYDPLVPPDVTTAALWGLVSGRKYYFRVVALGVDGPSTPSAWVEGIVPPL